MAEVRAEAPEEAAQAEALEVRAEVSAARAEALAAVREAASEAARWEVRHHRADDGAGIAGEDMAEDVVSCHFAVLY